MQVAWRFCCLDQKGNSCDGSRHHSEDVYKRQDIGIIDQGRMILEGNIQDILSRVNASNPLVISVYSNMEKALSILKSHPCVRTISMREKDICVRFTGDAQDEAILLQQLIDSDVLVNGFTREKGSLETVFMQLTDHEEERVVTSYEAESGL